MNYFWYNGHTSLDMGIVVEHAPEYSMAERVVETIDVPGRNGTLLVDTKAYSNVEQVYHVFFDGRKTSFTAKAHAISNWLLGNGKYMRLEDTYDPDVYRMARISKPDTMNNFMNKLGRFDVTFDCKPQRWLKVGEDELDLVSGEEVNNEFMDCHPIFKLTGNGTLTVNESTVTVTNNSSSTIIIDCDTQNAYTGTTNRNADITVIGEFPFLKHGINEISFTNSSCKMMPRYWTL